jgi:hypothetical protein
MECTLRTGKNILESLAGTLGLEGRKHLVVRHQRHLLAEFKLCAIGLKYRVSASLGSDQGKYLILWGTV